MTEPPASVLSAAEVAGYRAVHPNVRLGPDRVCGCAYGRCEVVDLLDSHDAVAAARDQAQAERDAVRALAEEAAQDANRLEAERDQAAAAAGRLREALRALLASPTSFVGGERMLAALATAHALLTPGEPT